MSDEPVKLKRFINAVKGKRLSWTSAYQINKELDTTYSGDDKLSVRDRARLAEIVFEMEARGVVPAKTLLTECQQAAQRKAKS